MKKEFNIWRVLAAATTISVTIIGIAWYKGYFQPLGFYRPSNSIMVLMPYRHAGTWVFDDAAVGLRQEPFVAGIPEMMDELVKDIPNADTGFRLLFSTKAFPGHTHKLVWRRSNMNGNWYWSEQYQKEGWLCPGLFKYYKQAPKEIFVKAEIK